MYLWVRSSSCVGVTGYDPTGARCLVLLALFWPWPLGALSGPALPSRAPLIPARSVAFLSKSVLSGTRCSGTILCVSRPGPRISCFSREAWLPFRGRGSEIRSERGVCLRPLGCHGVWGVLGPRGAGRGRVCAHSPLHVLRTVSHSISCTRWRPVLTTWIRIHFQNSKIILGVLN